MSDSLRPRHRARRRGSRAAAGSRSSRQRSEHRAECDRAPRWLSERSFAKRVSDVWLNLMSVNNSDPRKSGPEGALQPDLAAPLNLATGKLTSDAVAGCLTSSCVVINMCACVVGADMAVLPSAYREIGEDLDATPVPSLRFYMLLR
eukprot:SAG31_NODE_3890_length_3777_cov_5.473355_6_plen_147_part_00